jgi:uracil-DNA glycosylase family 4
MVARRSGTAGRDAWVRLARQIVACRRCPRLIEHCRAVARVRRRAFHDEVYWGRPVPGFGDPRARILLLGLAPAAHGANRTGRMFTGDRSGDWLYAALHRAGWASRPEARRRDDGLELSGAFVSAACRCAPPANRPTREELARCAGYLDRELELLESLRVVVALGRVAWDAALRRASRVGTLPRPRPTFAHGAVARLPLGRSGAPLWLVGSYHPSQQNTHTGRLTREMLDAVMRRAARLGADTPLAAE